MKSRLRKKYCGCRCAHDKSFDDMVTDDPYPMYINWFCCPRQPNYDNRPVYEIEDELNKNIFDITYPTQKMRECIQKIVRGTGSNTSFLAFLIILFLCKTQKQKRLRV